MTPYKTKGHADNRTASEKQEDDDSKIMFKRIAKYILEERDRKCDEIGLLAKQITFESKKCVSQVNGFFQNPKALKETEADLNTIINSERMFKGLALRLYPNEDLKYLALRRYSPAIEEFIEAVALLTFFKEGRLVQWGEIQKMLSYQLKVPIRRDNDLSRDEFGDGSQGGELTETVNFVIPVPQTMYYLGLADITGELVRACAAGCNTENFKKFLFNSRALVQTIYRGLLMINVTPRQLHEKMKTMLSSLIKLDTACYHATIRVERFKCIVTSDFFRRPTRTDDEEDTDFSHFSNQY